MEEKKEITASEIGSKGFMGALGIGTGLAIAPIIVIIFVLIILFFSCCGCFTISSIGMNDIESNSTY